LIVLAIALTSGCTVDQYGLRNPEAEAAAAAVQNETWIKRQNAETDLAIRRQNAEAELRASQQEIEARRLRAAAEADAIVASGQAKADGARAIAQAKAEAERGTVAARGQAAAAALVALGTGGQFAIVALGAGLAIAIIVTATGRSVAYSYNAILKARYVQIGVEPLTMLPPPIVVTADGFLIDTRSGERARIRDAAGVNRLKLAASTRNTETAQMARAVVETARITKSTTAAQDLPLIAASVPTMVVGE
jgi:hypothetical protein